MLRPGTREHVGLWALTHSPGLPRSLPAVTGGRASVCVKRKQHLLTHLVLCWPHTSSQLCIWEGIFHPSPAFGCSMEPPTWEGSAQRGAPVPCRGALASSSLTLVPVPILVHLPNMFFTHTGFSAFSSEQLEPVPKRGADTFR